MNKKQVIVSIKTEYVTLGQLLKIVDLIQSGGEAKLFLENNVVVIDGVVDNRRGRKLRDGTCVIIKDTEYKVSGK